MKITRKLQCQSIVQPGEYVIDIWDGKRCEETNPRLLLRCEGCDGSFCYRHWCIHVYSVPNDHFVAKS